MTIDKYIDICFCIALTCLSILLIAGTIILIKEFIL